MRCGCIAAPLPPHRSFAKLGALGPAGPNMNERCRAWALPQLSLPNGWKPSPMLALGCRRERTGTNSDHRGGADIGPESE